MSTESNEQPEVKAEEEARFVVHGGADSDSDIENVEKHLSGNPLILWTHVDEGCWYSNGEDGPRWVRLIAGCRNKDLEDLIESTRLFVGGTLTVNHY